MNSGMVLRLLLPLVGTSLGAAAVFFFKNGISVRIQKLMMGFAAGVMIAASVWSLLIPAMEMAETNGQSSWIPAVAGFLLGIGFLLLLDETIPHLHTDTNTPEGPHTGLGRTAMLVLAVTLHNIPEGMAVGVVLAGSSMEGAGVGAASALALSLGIAIQNFPEGAVISMPLLSGGVSRKRSFFYGFLSGVAEPVFALLTMAVTARILPVLPYILSFAAGAMLYVVIEELIPEAQAGEHSNIGTIGAAVGFCLMMILDATLG